MVKWFDKSGNVKRRGGILPGRLRNASRRGVTLVELMISMLILAIVCILWLQIIGIQSARKEARRREAVERLAGMMDAFMYCNKSKTSFSEKEYSIAAGTNTLEFPVSSNKNYVYPIYEELDKNGSRVSPIGYRLYVVEKGNLDEAVSFGDSWGKCKWLVGELYDCHGCSTDEAGKPFFVLPVCLGL